MLDKIPLSGSLPTILALLVMVVACDDGDSSTLDEFPPTPSLEATGTPVSPPFYLGLDRTYKVVYQSASPEGDRGDRYVVFNKPPLTRIDTIPPGSSDPASLVIGGEGAATISCSGGPRNWKCLEMEEALAESLLTSAGPIIFPSAEELQSFDIAETEGRTLAGQAARCFLLNPRGGAMSGDAEYCLGEGAVPLYARTDFGTVEATEFSVDVSDEDFRPPAEPQQQ